MIESGAVTVGGSFAQKTSRLVDDGEPIEILEAERYVSRGGEKMAAALDAFGLDVDGRSVMDAGASTGGFTDCVLQRGARRVFALDVGRNQLHERIKSDPRVVNRERTNIRDFVPTEMPFCCSLVMADLSFISLTKVVARLIECARPEPGFSTPQLVLLVKPQFEAGREEVSKGRGVIVDPVVHRRAIDEVSSVVQAHGGRVCGVVESPITGAEGNREFLMFVEVAVESVG